MPNATGRARPGPLILLLVLGALVLGACGGGDGDTTADPEQQATTTTDPGPPQPGGSLVYGLTAETDGWDPAASRWAPSGLIVANTFFDTLTRFNADGEIEPYLAESLTPNEDYTVWTVKLRPDVTFHNGEPLTAEAVGQNLDYHLDSELTGPIFAEIEDHDPIDELTLEIRLNQPFWNFPIALSTQIGVIAAPEMLEDPDRARNPIGTGPFEFENWSPDSSLTVVRNEDYWQTDEHGNQLPYLEQIEFRPLTDPTARASSLEGGEIDIAQMNDAISLERFAGSSGDYQLWQDPASENDEQFVMLNTQEPPFDEQIAREALAHATNREAYAEAQALGLFEPAEGPFHEESRWHTDVDYPEYDLARAQELVAQYEDEHGPFEFSIMSTSAPKTVQDVSYLQQVWQEAGIEASIENVEQSQLIIRALTGDYQSVMWAQFGSAHPLLETPWWHCDYVDEEEGGFSLNFAHNCDEELSEALDQARIDDDPDNQTDYYDTVQERLAETIPYIWLVHTETTIVARPGVVSIFDYALPSGSDGLPLNNGAHPLQQVWLTS